jgi:ribonucleoside-diphosphate reductase alpha chain
MTPKRNKTLPLSEHARMVLARRYLKKDPDGRVVETPAEMLQRTAEAAASAEGVYGGPREEMAERFYALMADFDFLPNTPTLINAGRELGQLSACFVLPVEDSIESIFNAVRDTAVIHKSGGGTGFSFSRLRPANDVVKSTSGLSSGPVSFMSVFDTATETIKQGGVRRGANMGLLSAHHPDILDFIEVKSREDERYHNFNLSVSATQRFMDAVREDREYELINPRNDQVTARLPAAEVFDRLARAAWGCGDPGLVFIDRVNQANPLPHLGPIEATNPCGEQPLLPYESCNLGSINIARFVVGDRIDYQRLGRVVDLAVRFLDNIIDVNRFPLPEIGRMTRLNRKIGLGVMGLADLLAQLRLPYASKAALAQCEAVMAFIQKRSREASAELGRLRGNFPSFPGSRLEGETPYMRNATTTTIAPTGSLSLIAGCSSGVEPFFGLSYTRRLLDNQEIVEINPLFQRLAREAGFWSESLAERVSQTGSVADDPEVPAEYRELFKTAHEIPPLDHLQVQAAFQRHTDNAVSKTVNLPNSATVEDVRNIFLTADDLGLKGVTAYRDACRLEQVLSLGRRRGEAAGPSGRGVDGPCPECGVLLEDDQGCWLCSNCGYSRCH